jgi:hypothetical protein
LTEIGQTSAVADVGMIKNPASSPRVAMAEIGIARIREK